MLTCCVHLSLSRTKLDVRTEGEISCTLITSGGINEIQLSSYMNECGEREYNIGDYYIFINMTFKNVKRLIYPKPEYKLCKFLSLDVAYCLVFT